MIEDFDDVLIIGAGVVGCALARELSRYELRVTVLEKDGDVASATSGRNSAVVHAGFNNRPGSLMARFCVEGNRGFEQVCRDLDVPYRKTGKVLIAFDEEDLLTLRHLVKQGYENGCSGLRMITSEEVNRLIHGVGGIGGMYSPHTAIFNPFLFCVGLAENAHANGVKFSFDSEVTLISRSEGLFVTGTSDGRIFRSICVVNCAGLNSDQISTMAGIEGYRINPCRGEYLILDKDEKGILPIPVYPAPKKGIGGLGVHLTPTTDGNIIIGPSAEYIDEREDYSCTSKIMDKLKREASQLLPEIATCSVIGAYSGIRPKQTSAYEGGFSDFVIREEQSCPGFINLIGIESPGFTSSIPIAKHVVTEILSSHFIFRKKNNFIPTRRGIVRFRELDDAQKEDLIRKDSEYGDIVCRCQCVSRSEIRQAVENPLGVKTLAGIKYRAWATTGRCNGGYCFQKIAHMLVSEYGFNAEDVRYRTLGSNMFSGRVK